MSESSNSVKAVFYALGANSGISLAKAVAAYFTGSGAMLAEALHSFATAVGKQRVQKLTRLHGIRVKVKQHFKVTTDSNHKLPISPNLLNREFALAKSDGVWAGDTPALPLMRLGFTWPR